MALKGNLRDFAVTQLLNLVNLAQKTGSLIVVGMSDLAQITFREGKLAYATLDKQDGSLAAILHRSKKISSSQYRTLKERSGTMSDKELGLLLINAGYLTQEDIITSLQQNFMAIIRQMFTWNEGDFRFDNGVMPPDGKIMVRMDLENLIIEGVHNLKEWEHLTEEIPSLEMSLKFTDRPGNNLRNINLTVEEWRVISFVNPKNTIKQIARAVKMNDLDIRRVVYGLIQAGLIEITRPLVPAGTPTRQVLPAKNKTEQKSLINRLIARIRSL